MKRSSSSKFVPSRLAHRVQCAAMLVWIATLGCSSTGQNAETAEVIPLASIYSTSGQEDLKHLALGGSDVIKDAVERFMVLRPRVSNIFLVQAPNEQQAFEAALTFNGSDDSLTNDTPLKTWLVVFLGSRSSSPPKWKINSVESGQSKVILRYSVEKPTQSTRDLHPYFFLVPLKAPTSKEFHLELYETTTKRTVMTRTVSFQSKPRD